MRKKRPRLATFDYVGHYRYFLTFATHLRRKHFADAATVDLVRSHLLRSGECHEIEITAYCFMPDHLHLFVQGCSVAADLRRFVRLAKQTSGFAYSRFKNGPLWQPSYYDRALRDDESSLWIIAYILRNPVVAGLAARCEDYPFVGSGAGDLNSLIEMLREGLGPDWEAREWS